MGQVSSSRPQWCQDLPLRPGTQAQYKPRYQQQQQQYPVSQQNYQAQYQTQYQNPQTQYQNPQAPQLQGSQSQASQPSRQVYTQYRPQPQRFGQAQAAPQAPRSQLLLSDKPYNSSQSERQGYNRPRALLADTNPSALGDEDEARSVTPRSPYVEDELFLDDSFEPELPQASDQYDLYDDDYEVPQDGPSDFPALTCAPDEDVVISCLQCDSAFPSNNQLPVLLPLRPNKLGRFPLLLHAVLSASLISPPYGYRTLMFPLLSLNQPFPAEPHPLPLVFQPPLSLDHFPVSYYQSLGWQMTIIGTGVRMSRRCSLRFSPTPTSSH
ncbi:hypothetical protein N7490_007312 [Penicillium lividum]|nr:hypothetical protein N7490_007312 [Penicillium lividum]